MTNLPKFCSWGDYKMNSKTHTSIRNRCCPCKGAPIFWSVNWAAALLHLVNGFATLGLWASSDTREHVFSLSETSAPWANISGTNGCTTGLPGNFIFKVSDDYCVYRVSNITSSLSLWWLVIVFHFLSFGFQAIAMVQWRCTCCGTNWVRDYIKEVDEDGTNVLRFIEYSISATLMQIAIALILGIWDRLVIIGIAFLTVVTMLLGLIAEQLKNDNHTIAWVTHFTGWFSLGGVWAIIGRQFAYTLQTSGEILPPTFVYIIVGVITLLYSGFGIIQFVQIYKAGQLVDNPNEAGQLVDKHNEYKAMEELWVTASELEVDGEEGTENNLLELTTVLHDGGNYTIQAIDNTKNPTQYRLTFYYWYLDTNRVIEMAYCINSLTSKTFLGWIIFANALAGMAQS